MTTIVGVSTGVGCWLAGDSAVTFGDEVTIQRASKVWRSGQIIMGTAGGCDFESKLRTLELRDTRNPDVWGAELAEACADLEADDETVNAALIGCAGKLWHFEPGSRPWAFADPWGAIGSGAAPASAILRLSAKRGVRRALGWDARKRLTAALEAAEALTVGTRRPFKFLEW